MELARLIEALSDPAAYPAPDRVEAEGVEVHQTHISVVFLAGRHAYKIKKPVAPGFLDFSTLEKRRFYCEEEVRLNRRLAPEVYLGVVPVARDGATLRVEGRGAVVEWAVKMERLPESATLRARLDRGEIAAGEIDDLARRLAAFHAAAGSGSEVASDASFEAVARNARENFDFAETAALVGVAISREVLDRLVALNASALDRHRGLIEDRAARGIPRDTHGDLRLDHVYRFPDRVPPGDWVVVDCIEFSEQFRHADPVSDVAFLAMELNQQGRADLAGTFADAYFRASGDEPGRVLLPFYRAYRAAVRAKVEGIKSAEPEVPEADRAGALIRSRGLWLRALDELEIPDRRPALVLVAGLPGTGKSTLARGLAGRAGFVAIRSDEVRKELAGPGHGASGFGMGIYTAEWDERTYAECLRRADRLIFEGRRVLVDASFRAEARRRLFLESADAWGVRSGLLLCIAPPEVVRARLARRQGDASDADWPIHEQAARRWEEPGPDTRASVRAIDSGDDPARALAQALGALREFGLLGEQAS